MSGTNWYSLTLYSVYVSDIFFRGFFCTNSSNILTGLYETVNGYTNINDNKLIDTTNLTNVGTNRAGFTVYSLDNFNIDNAYLPSWGNNFSGSYEGGIGFKNITYTNFLDSTSTQRYVLRNQSIDRNSSHTVSATRIPNYNSTHYIIGVAIKPTFNPFCFNIGTQILTLNTENNKFKEQYVLIENLNVGTLVKNHRNEYREVELIESERLINKPHKIEETMYVLKKEKNKDLIEDLYITGTHSILVDNIDEYKDLYNIYKNGEIMKIDNKYLLFSAFSKDFEKINKIKEFIVYQFVLKNDNNDSDERLGVYANGILVDLPTKNEFLIHYNNNNCDENNNNNCDNNDCDN